MVRFCRCTLMFSQLPEFSLHWMSLSLQIVLVGAELAIKQVVALSCFTGGCLLRHTQSFLTFGLFRWFWETAALKESPHPGFPLLRCKAGNPDVVSRRSSYILAYDNPQDHLQLGSKIAISPSFQLFPSRSGVLWTGSVRKALTEDWFETLRQDEPDAMQCAPNTAWDWSSKLDTICSEWSNCSKRGEKQHVRTF